LTTRTPPEGAACTQSSQSTHSSKFSSTIVGGAVGRLREDVHGADLGQLLRQLAVATTSGVMSTRMNIAVMRAPSASQENDARRSAIVARIFNLKEMGGFW